MAEFYTKNQINKLGNALIFLCTEWNRVGENVSKTHILKLIFIIEEISVKKFGVPFFNMRFDVWKLGPVSRDLFYELTEEPTLLADYISIEQTKNGVIVKSKKEFSDDEFSDKEIELLKEISNRFLYCTANELINYTHKRNSPWYDTAMKHGVLELLETGAIPPTTDIEIDLSETIADDQIKLSLYHGYKDFVSRSKYLKS